MYSLENLTKLVKKRKRVGRGGSRGGTSGKGSKGQLARTGGASKVRAGFEGGQMPISRRLPKRGFNNARFQKDIEVVGLDRFEVFEDGAIISRIEMASSGLIKDRRGSIVKVLGGELSKKLTIVADLFSKSAEQKIKDMGGEVKLTKES